MAKKRRSRRKPEPVEEPKPTTSKASHATRETIESVAIAFVLAFVFRTFVAEAFIIPTGSMSPSLMGAHKDVCCQQCGTRFRANSSTDDLSSDLRPWKSAGAGICPQCRHVATFDKKIGDEFGDPTVEHDNERTYPGDRIVVSKYLYLFNEPKRWDVVVFKYPGDAYQNYIKRLVGLPGETLRLWQGDVFIAPPDSGPNDFAIERKPPRTVMAMRQLVHDTDHDPASLHRHGFPLRWQDDESTAWEIDAVVDARDNNVTQTYRFGSDAADMSWLQYRHIVPSADVWRRANEADLNDKQLDIDPTAPQLVSDFNPYNSRWNRDRFLAYDLYRTTTRPSSVLPPIEPRSDGQGSVIGVSPTDQIPPEFLGLHWVGDLMLEAEIDFQSTDGVVALQLVEAGHRFQCFVDISSGDATLSIVPWESTEPAASYAPKASTKLKGSGKHKIQFANVDDQLLLWIDGNLIEFDQATTYDWEKLFGDRRNAQPRLGEDNTGDMTPAAVGAQGAKLSINRLAVYRDIYYIAVDRGASVVTEIAPAYWGKLLNRPDNWHVFSERELVDFQLEKDQFFVMGDNSPQSSDARIWSSAPNANTGSQPAGPYLDRTLLIGRAVFVAWPHPWYHIPGTPIPVFPNFGDMRLIR